MFIVDCKLPGSSKHLYYSSNAQSRKEDSLSCLALEHGTSASHGSSTLCFSTAWARHSYSEACGVLSIVRSGVGRQSYSSTLRTGVTKMPFDGPSVKGDLTASGTCPGESLKSILHQRAER